MYNGIIDYHLVIFIKKFMIRLITSELELISCSNTEKVKIIIKNRQILW